MALLKSLTNPYRPVGAQTVDAYCVARVTHYDADARIADISLDAYDGACSKAERAAGTIKPFKVNARQERVTGDLFDQFFATAVLDAAGSNILRQAYLCATRSILAEDGVTETNEWAGAAAC